MIRFLFTLFLLGFGGMLFPLQAQMFSQDANEDFRGQTTRSLTVGYYIVDFRFNGEGNPQQRYDFAEPVYALQLSISNRSSIALAFSIGEERNLIDFTSQTINQIPLSRVGSEMLLYVPLAVQLAYRQVGSGNSGNVFGPSQDFSYGSIAIGPGLGLGGRLSRDVVLELRVAAPIGLAIRNFDEQIGSLISVDGLFELKRERLFGRIGLTVGYGYRYQKWNNGSSSLLGPNADQIFDYVGTQHMARIGINF